MTKKKCYFKLAAVLLLSLVLLTVPSVATGTIYFDTNNIVKTGNVLTIPVCVEDATNMCGYDLKIQSTGGTFVFNPTTITSGLSVNDETGIVLWRGYAASPFTSITGDATLFAIDVTPSSGSDTFQLSLSVGSTQEGTSIGNAVGVSTYSTGSAVTLTPEGKPATPPATPTPTPTVTPTVPPTEPTTQPTQPTQTGDEVDNSTGEPEVVPTDTIPDFPDIPTEPTTQPDEPTESIPIPILVIGAAILIILLIIIVVIRLGRR